MLCKRYTCMYDFLIMALASYTSNFKREMEMQKQKPTCYAGGVNLYRKTPFRYNRVVQSLLQERKGVLWRISLMISPIQNGCVNTILYLLLSIDEKIIYNQLKEDIRDILKQLCAYKGVEIIEGHLMPDHIHMLVSIPPKMSVSSLWDI